LDPKYTLEEKVFTQKTAKTTAGIGQKQLTQTGIIIWQYVGKLNVNNKAKGSAKISIDDYL
jgi:hypothetical protein